jgi:hypothetical protein
MPVTGKLYDPGTPSALEAALAQVVASGQSPFAGALLTGYATQRQQNVQAVNEAQAQSHLLDLANLLQQEKMKSATSLAGAGLSSGRGIGPTLGAVNNAVGLGMDPSEIAAAGAQADMASNLNMAETGAKIQNLGSEAGGGVADVSPVLQGLGFGITPTGTPRGVRQSEISAKATTDAARIHAGATTEAARIKGSGGGGGGKETVEISGVDPQTREGYKARIPLSKASPGIRAAINKASGDAAADIDHANAGSPFTPSGDAINNDPALADQLAQITRQFPGYTLVNGNGDPRDVTAPDGTVYREFKLIDPQGNHIPARVVKRQ